MRQLMKLHYYAVQLLASFTAFCIALLILIIGAEAIIRSLGFGYVLGVIDISEFSLFFIAVLAAPWLLRENQHIRVDILITQLSSHRRYQAERLIYLIILAVAATILFYSCKVFMESWHFQELVIRELAIPDWWLQWQVPVAMLLICIDLIQRLFFPGCRYEPATKSWLDADDSDQLESASAGEQ